MHKRNIIVLSLILILSFLFTGCSDLQWNAYQSKIKDAKSTSSKKQPISPLDDSATQKKSDIVLYFGSAYDDYFLYSDSRTVNVPVNERIEKIIVQELIKGPGSDRTEFKSLFNSNVKVMSVTNNKDYIFVTLSKEFLDVPTGMSKDDFAKQKRLAIYSIVNSLTELGTYSRVQIEIADNSGQGKRVTLEDAGFKDTGDMNKKGDLLGPLARNGDIILTPQRTVIAMFESFIKKDWETVYRYIASKDQNNGQKLEISDFNRDILSYDPTLEDYNVYSENISNNGQSAVVTISCHIKNKYGKIISIEMIPAKLFKENGVWKVSYTLFSDLYENN